MRWMRSTSEAGRAARRPWTLHRRIAVAIATTGLLSLGVVVASGALLVRVQAEQQNVTEDYNLALRISADYLSALNDAETALRGYALTGDPNDLAPLEGVGTPGDGELPRTVARYIPEQTAALAKLTQTDEAAGAWYQGWARPALADLQAGRQLDGQTITRGKELFDRFRAAYADYLATARTSRAEANDQLGRLTTLMFGAVLASALIAVGVTATLWALLVRWVSRPVTQLGRQVRTVRDGALDHPVMVNGAAELVELGQDVDRMRGQLVQQIAEVEAAGEQLRVAHARLAEQTADLARSNRDLEQFAYVASHDLQEPLRKVASFCQLLQTRYADRLDERADQYIHYAVDGATRMQHLINDLLDFARVGRQPVTDDEVDLAACLRQATTNLSSTLTANRATITSDELPVVRGESGLLVQLFQNLIGNAVKFRADEAPRVHLGVTRSDLGWQFSCRDNGIGIDPAHAERVFVIFQRLHPRDAYTGTGIGLALCSRIVEYHGGKIWLGETPAGGGTTIRWTLPLTAARRGAA